MRHASAVLAAWALAASAAGAQDRRTIVVEASAGALRAPATAPAGWLRLQLRWRGAGLHNLAAFRLPAGVRPEAFVAALDTARATPLGATALSGPEGSSARRGVVLRLDAGAYVLACLHRRDGRRHAATGEWRVLRVERPATASDTGRAPRAPIDLPMADFAFLGPDAWPAGERTVHAHNVGREDHLVLVRRLHPGKTLRDFAEADDPGTVSDAVGGATRLGPGGHAYLPLALAPGRYVLVCLVPSAAMRRPHAELGMVRLVTVR